MFILWGWSNNGRGCGILIFRDTQHPSGCGPGQSALCHAVWAEGLDYVMSRDPFKPKEFPASVSGWDFSNTEVKVWYESIHNDFCEPSMGAIVRNMLTLTNLLQFCPMYVVLSSHFVAISSNQWSLFFQCSESETVSRWTALMCFCVLYGFLRLSFISLQVQYLHWRLDRKGLQIQNRCCWSCPLNLSITKCSWYIWGKNYEGLFIHM